jgi:hypothetical protein
MVAARLSSRAGSRQASASGGVLGLPSTIDPSLLDNDFGLPGFSDAAFGLGTYDWAGPNVLDMSGNDFDANQFQYGEFAQDGQIGLGLGLDLVPVEPEFHAQSDPTLMPYNQAGEALQDQPDLVPVDSLDPALKYQNPDFQFWDPTLAGPSQLLDTTPGFSAFPGGTSFIPQLPLNGQHSQMYPDPYASTYHADPYFQPQYPQQYTGYIPMPAEQHPALQHVHDSHRSNPRRSTQTDNNRVVQHTQKRKRARSYSGSEDDAPLVKRTRQDPPTKRSRPSDASRRHSEVSDNSSVSKPVKVLVVKAGEKPKRCEEKPWVRINNITKGETTRTARINQYTENGPSYKTKDIPHGDWESSNYKFEYSQNYGMHEFKKRTMSARQIHDYITEYPGNELRIWIQPAPSDAARRYASTTHSHCRLEKCPMRKWTTKGTIGVGDYRVAFDEKHKTHGMGLVSPYDCVGYVHLYCMERFLDFAYICQVADVRVDTRGDLPKEPNSHFAGAFGVKQQAEAALAKKFVSAAKQGRLSETHEFSQYPVHEDYSKGEPKQHDRTLIHGLFKMNIEHRAPSQLKQFLVQRTAKPGAFPVHLGDMEVKLVDKKIESLDAFKDAVKNGTKAQFDYSAYYDDFHPEIKLRQADCAALRERLLAGNSGTASKRSRKRKAAPAEDSGDESPAPAPAPKHASTHKRKAAPADDDDFEQVGNGRPQRSGSRSSPRKKQRIDYSEPQESQAGADTVEALPGYQPARPLDPSKASCSGLFPVEDDSWANLQYDQEFIDRLINEGRAHYRRKSSTLSRGPYSSALRSPQLQRAPRTASFNAQPVTSSQSFSRNDPPSHVAAVYEQHNQTRRSKRIASKSSSPPSPDRTRSGRVEKRRHQVLCQGLKCSTTVQRPICK